MNEINTGYSPSFQANLAIEGLKFSDQKKLNAVKQLFAQKTQHYAGDTLSLKDFVYNAWDTGYFRHGVTFNVNDGLEELSAHTPVFKEFFENNSAEDVARGLVRIFKLGKANEVFNNKIAKISRNVRRAYAANARNLDLAVEAERCCNRVHAKNLRYLAESNEQRANTLIKQRKALKELHGAISQKIVDHPIFDIVL